MDTKQFETLYRDCKRSVTNYIGTVIGDYDIASDLCHDAYLSILERLPNIDEAGAISYLYRTAYTTAIDYIRERNRYTDRNEPSLPDTTQEHEDDYSILYESIASLPEKQSVAIYLHYFEGKTYAEIAKTLNTNENTVNTLLYRAKNKLRDMMRDHNG